MVDLYNFQLNVKRFYIDKAPASLFVESLLEEPSKESVARLIGDVAILLARISNEYDINMDYAIASTWWLVNHENDNAGR